MKHLLIWVAGLWGMGLWAQDSARFDKHFRFVDGCFLSWEAFRQNRPELPIDSVRVVSFTNPRTRRTVIDRIHTLGGVPVQPDSVQVFVRKGIPYLAVRTSWTGDTTTAFVPLKVRGKICYFTWTDTEMNWTRIQAWNPKTGKPFRTGRVPVAKEVVRQQLLHFPSGKRVPFHRDGLASLVADDAEVLAQVRSLSPDADPRRLYQLLLLYDERNPIYLPVR